jgi:hypothetical protein
MAGFNHKAPGYWKRNRHPPITKRREGVKRAQMLGDTGCRIGSSAPTKSDSSASLTALETYLHCNLMPKKPEKKLRGIPHAPHCSAGLRVVSQAIFEQSLGSFFFVLITPHRRAR